MVGHVVLRLRCSLNMVLLALLGVAAAVAYNVYFK